MATGKKQKKPKAAPTDETLKPADGIKGTYFRRLKDIQRGLSEIDSKMPSGGRFLFLYMAARSWQRASSVFTMSGLLTKLTNRSCI
jgi:hypothetical protein